MIWPRYIRAEIDDGDHRRWVTLAPGHDGVYRIQRGWAIMRIENDLELWTLPVTCDYVDEKAATPKDGR